jgi:hypothetical protein
MEDLGPTEWLHRRPRARHDPVPAGDGNVKRERGQVQESGRRPIADPMEEDRRRTPPVDPEVVFRERPPRSLHFAL